MRARRLTSLAALTALAAHANAQQLPEGVLRRQTPTLGRENVASSGFEAARTARREDSEDGTELKLSAGGLFAAGNSRSLAVTGTSKLYARRGNNQLGAGLSATYGQSALQGEREMRTSVENFQAKLRFDRFVAEHFAVFLSQSGLRDRFQGLSLRLNLDPGFAYYFVDAGKHRLWGEAGYDVQYDFRRQQAVNEAAANGRSLARSEILHSTRAFLGYANNFAELLTLDTGVEYLQALTESKSYRLNWDLGLSARFSPDFSIATTVNFRYDHDPLPDVQRTDVAMAVSLVYQLL